MLTLLHVIRFQAIRKRLMARREAARSIRQEREIFRRWSRRSFEDRFTL